MRAGEWTGEHDRELARLLHKELTARDIAEQMGVSATTIHRHRRTRAVRQEVAALRASSNDVLPDTYYQGVAGHPDETCPFPMSDLQNRCWWLAGWHDADRGLT